MLNWKFISHLSAGKSFADVEIGVDVFAVGFVVFGVDGTVEIAVTVADAEMAGVLFVSLVSLDSLVSFESFVSFSSFGSFSFFLAERLFFGGAFDAHPWQYHLPRGTFIIGGI